MLLLVHHLPCVLLTCVGVHSFRTSQQVTTMTRAPGPFLNVVPVDFLLHSNLGLATLSKESLKCAGQGGPEDHGLALMT